MALFAWAVALAGTAVGGGCTRSDTAFGTSTRLDTTWRHTSAQRRAGPSSSSGAPREPNDAFGCTIEKMRVYAAVATGLLLVNCGGSSRREVLPRVSAGAGGVEAAPATPAAGLAGTGIGGEAGSTPVLMGVGGTSAGGTSAGGASVGGASAGGISGSSMAGGVGAWQSWLGDGGAPPVEGDGFGCGSGRCAAGELCIGCIVPKVTTRLQCVPDPRRDPDGYAATVAMDCMHPGGYIDCDGPEDCPSGSYCVLGAVGLAYGAQCQAELPAPDRNCCFDCDSVVLPLCILCAGDSDCPPGNVCVPPPAGYEPNAGGCEPAPSSGG